MILFGTLTVDDYHHNKVFTIGSPYWASYIQRLRRKAEKIHGKKPNHHYFAVTERGESSNRLHIHVIHVFDAFQLACPNGRNPYMPTRRSINELSTTWICGFSQHIPIRIEPGDYWGSQCQHVWPKEPAGRPREEEHMGHNQESNYVPLRGTNPLILANYLIKYLTKSYMTTTKTHWRTKATQEFGVRTLTSIINELTSEQIVRILCRRPINLSLRNGLMIPASLIKTVSTKVIANRTNMTQTLALPAVQDLKSQVKDAQTGGRYRDLMNFGIECLANEATANDNQIVIKHLLTRLHEELHISMEALSYGNAQQG